jgi:hypothetical protein
VNRILITGCPRSGTSQFCKILSKNNNINLWSDGHEYQYEPFSTRPSMRFDESDWIQNFLNRNESEFVGFKMFNGDTSSVTETAKRFDMKLIPVLRKDIISVYLSLALLPLQEKNKNNHSSRNTNCGLEKILFEVGGFRRLRKNAFWLLKQYYLWERTPTFQKVYFEDMMNGVEYPKLNEYFNTKITFGLDGYKHMGYETYTKDWEKLLSPLADMLHLAKKSGNFPDYIHNVDI